MAGDWIKMRAGLQTHPKIVRILSAMRPHDVQTRTDKFRVIGGLHAVWCVFDEHCEDGVLFGYTPETLDHIIGWEGFAQAMISVGWLDFDGSESLALPEFDEHNSQSAKRRAEDQKRKRDARKATPDVRNLSGDDADKVRTESGLEKRREDIKEKNPPTPLSTDVDAAGQKADAKRKRQTGEFERFWAAWPKSPRKVGKAACEAKWKRVGLDDQADAIVAHVEAMAGSQQWREGFEPSPQTYLNQRRWEDGVPADRPAPQPGQAAHGADWWESAAGIEEEGERRQVARKSGEDFFRFKVRVFKAAGQGKWRDIMLADLLRTKSQAYASVFEYFNGTPPMDGV